MDLYSRKILSCKISIRNTKQLTSATFKESYSIRQPKDKLLFHNDRGGNYVSKSFVMYLKKLGVVHSFSDKGVPYDNSVEEAFFKNLKYEEIYRTNYHSEKEFKRCVYDYIYFYNNERPHATLNYMTPEQKEKEYFQSKNDKTDVNLQ